MSEEKTEIETEETPEEKPSWSFPRTFWTGNAAELCRALREAENFTPIPAAG